LHLHFKTSPLKREASRFIIVGILNTSIHAAIALYASYILNFSIVAANLSGFFVATIFSFVINTTWSFSRRLSKRFFTRFFLVSLLLFSFNLMVSKLAEEYQVIPAVAILLAATMSPAISFLLHKFWTYKNITT